MQPNSVEPDSVRLNSMQPDSARTRPVQRESDRLKSMQRGGWIAAAAGAILCVLGGLLDRRRLGLSYLAAHFLFLGISLGSLALLMIHRLTGGRWGVLIRGPLEAGVRVLPAMALLFLPLLFDVRSLYPWAAGPAASDPESGWYLDRPFFLARAVLYFAVWLWLAWRFTRAEPADITARHIGRRRWAAGGLVLYALTVSFAAVDWEMSLVPRWPSSEFGLMVGTSQLQVAMAFAAFVVALAAFGATSPREGSARQAGNAPPDSDARRDSNDLGKLILTLVLLWAYLLYMEYLTVWVGNLPAEIRWYVPRVQTSWRIVSLLVVFLNAVLPFVLLLARACRESRAVLLAASAAILVGHWLYGLWLTVPSIQRDGIDLAWQDAAALLFIGGVWLACWTAFRRAGQPAAAGFPRTVADHG